MGNPEILCSMRCVRNNSASQIDLKSASGYHTSNHRAAQDTSPVKAWKPITVDNGTKNAKHEKLTARLGVKCFFAHP